MVATEQLYAVIVAALLLVALGVSIPVLKRIVTDGLERRRKRRAGDLERYTEDEEYGLDPSTALEEDGTEPTRLPCRQCGAKNDPSFSYCRRCAAPL